MMKLLRTMDERMDEMKQSQKDADERMDERMKQSQKDADERMTKFKGEMAKTISESVVKAVAESKNDKDGIQLILIFHDLSFTNIILI